MLPIELHQYDSGTLITLSGLQGHPHIAGLFKSDHFASLGWVRSIVMCMSVCLFVRSRNWKITRPNFT